ncbi:D-alanyl-D-alanine-carboxypeptidase/endopeptidase AmpH [Thorsellia anophelis]
MLNPKSLHLVVNKKITFALLTISTLCYTSHSAAISATEALASEYAKQVYQDGQAQAMAMVVIHGDERYFFSHGETIKGNGKLPRPNSLIRIASITKPIVSEVLVNLANENIINLNDPLQKYAPQGKKVPLVNQEKPITLLSLAMHTSGLPREQPNKPQKKPVFTWPTQNDRWKWLNTATPKAAAFDEVSYSNLGYDLLADALSQATGRSFHDLLKTYIFIPNQMHNTTLTPTQAQCNTLMKGFNAGPCMDNTAAHGSGGIYSTPEDIGNWMQGFLSNSKRPAKPLTDQLLWTGFKRYQFLEIIGMDVPGQAAEFGLGWVVLDPEPILGTPRIIQKTGGGGGFVTYMALIPEKNIGVFTVVTRTQNSKFKGMSNNVNQLVAKLSDL